ncbi:sulfatase-like hydrolase/transferase, partial [Mailhella sp.]|uniref:sulfatase-like hydrolase/transferase n=1 Tax=Mailhella sp. TaxID=1981029 RepID=UPI004063C144
DKVTGAYDNSILYNDHVMQNIYEYFSKLKNFKAMIYMADHADAVTKKLGHDSSRFDFDMTRIPVWLTFSQDYFENRTENIQNLQKRKNTPFTNDLMFDLLMGLLGIRDTSYYDKKFDLCSRYFNLSPNKLKTLHGKKYIRDDPLLTSQFK